MIKPRIVHFLLLFGLGYLLSFDKVEAWGFFAHQKINRLAVFILPPEMMPFYKKHIKYLMENSVKPDMRRGILKAEAPRHFIDQEAYEKDSSLYKMPKIWSEALAKYSEDTLMKHGIVPYHIGLMKFKLVEAFKSNDAREILRLSAEIGHYIADANVPLHTTKNYNGQLTNQIGVHGLWESRLPELFINEYDLFVGAASFEKNTTQRIWKNIQQSNACVDSVLKFDRLINQRIPDAKKYTIEVRGANNKKNYSKLYASEYQKALNAQVERQMKSSVKMIGDFWFTCWVEAGQPDLNKMLDFKLTEQQIKYEEKEEKSWLEKIFEVRTEE